MRISTIGPYFLISPLNSHFQICMDPVCDGFIEYSNYSI